MSVTASMRYGKGGDSAGASIIADEVELVDDYSVAASDLGSASGSVAKAGYRALGITGVSIENATNSGSGSSYIGIYRWQLVGNTATVSFRNRRSSACKIKVTVFVLYIRS